MTLTMKLKRKRIAQKYAVDIADLYSAEPPRRRCTSRTQPRCQWQVRATNTSSTTVEYTVTVNRSVEDTWRFLTEFENMPKWARGVAEIVAISPGPLAVGTTVTDIGLGLKRRWRETFFGRGVGAWAGSGPRVAGSVRDGARQVHVDGCPHRARS